MGKCMKSACVKFGSPNGSIADVPWGMLSVRNRCAHPFTATLICLESDDIKEIVVIVGSLLWTDDFRVRIHKCFREICTDEDCRRQGSPPLSSIELLMAF